MPISNDQWFYDMRIRDACSTYGVINALVDVMVDVNI